MRVAYASRRDVAVNVLKQRGRYQYSPHGAFYILVDISDSGLSGRDCALALLKEKHVAVAPGDTFGSMANHYVRISIASSEENIAEGLHKLCDFLDERKKTDTSG